MGKQILTLVVMTLLIATSFSTVFGSENNKKEKNKDFPVLKNTLETNNECTFQIETYSTINEAQIHDDHPSFSTIYEGWNYQFKYWCNCSPSPCPVCIWIDPASSPIPEGMTIIPEPPIGGTGSVSCTLTWSPGYCQAGYYDIIFCCALECYDPEHQKTHCQINVLNKNRNPTIEVTPKGPISVYAGESIHLDVTGTDPDISDCGWTDDPCTLTCTDMQHFSSEQLSGSFDWTTTTDDVGEYNVGFTITDNNSATDTEDVTIEVQGEVECHDQPMMTDRSGETTFHGIFIGVDYPGWEGDCFEGGARAMEHELKKHAGWDNENTDVLTGNGNALKDNIRQAIDKYKDGNPDTPDLQPGDEFLFYFIDHGSNVTDTDPIDEEPAGDNKDERLCLNGAYITDDELTEWLSGFPECVTITLKLDCCHSGGFDDVVKRATNSNGDPYEGSHINLDNPCGEDSCTYASPHEWNDDGDNIIEPEELSNKDLDGVRCEDWDGDDNCDIDEDVDGDGHLDVNEDTNGNGILDEGEDVDGDGHLDVDEDVDGDGHLDRKDHVFIWEDKNDNGVVDWETDGIYWTDPTYSPDWSTQEHLSDIDAWMGDWTYLNLLILRALRSLSLSDFIDNPDRNNDGILTTKEAYEYSILQQYEKSKGDNDNDGLIDEDGPEFDLVNGINKRLYLDNDHDGKIDEDPAPPKGGNFCPNEKPKNPYSLTGQTRGNQGETYTYSTRTTDDDGDDVYFWFDWGDGTNTGWLGPCSSGDDCEASHSWNTKGDYTIKVKARDRCFAESNWETLQVSMPKGKLITSSYSFLENLIQNYPHLYILLHHLLGI